MPQPFWHNSEPGKPRCNVLRSSANATMPSDEAYMWSFWQPRLHPWEIRMLCDASVCALLLHRHVWDRGQGLSTKFPLQHHMSKKLQPGA